MRLRIRYVIRMHCANYVRWGREHWKMIRTSGTLVDHKWRSGTERSGVEWSHEWSTNVPRVRIIFQWTDWTSHNRQCYERVRIVHHQYYFPFKKFGSETPGQKSRSANYETVRDPNFGKCWTKTPILANLRPICVIFSVTSAVGALRERKRCLPVSEKSFYWWISP